MNSLLISQINLTKQMSLFSLLTLNSGIFKLPRLDTNDIPKQANAPINVWFQKAK